ncbi:sulfate ABC transporter substrate-binding protein [Synechococcus elongatus IITB7]|uniref:sulfate ABC transporter substrate-binding protein n=1 Tax=Synechococcus elongatus TaxID=32046 RepID=UPI0030CB6E66
MGFRSFLPLRPGIKRSLAGGLAAAIAAGSFATTAGARNAQTNAAGSTPQQVAQAKQELVLVSYAVTKAAYDRIIPKFTAKWKREKGQDVTIRGSYGGSGSQTRAILDGLEADIAALALESDTARLERAGLIGKGWQKRLPNNSNLSSSVVVICTRKGNPKKIRGWSDLARPGVRIVTANPKTSGGARWNFLALYGSVAKNGGTEKQAFDFVKKVYDNVPVLAKDARESTDIFYKKNQGDVLLNYENEVILARLNGEDVGNCITPQVNIAIETPIAVVDKIANKRKTKAIADAFTRFVFTPEAQEELAKVGFRPANAAVAQKYRKNFPPIQKLFNIRSFGGWAAADKKFFSDGGIFDQIQGR